MFVHNFYSDLLLSTRILFDKYIFKRLNYIKRYEFNYGNRAFQLHPDYKQNYEFPVILVNLTNNTPTFGQRTSTIQQTPTQDINHVPILYNKTLNKYLLVQEEQTSISLSITINCESQFQAKEIEHVILRYLPLSKYISIFDYTCFLELDNDLINRLNFDINNHEFVNLYTKLNNNTGKVNHCFSIQYRPLLRNESLSTNISDSTQRSFQVTLELTYMLQLPIFIFDDEESIIDSINFNYGNYGFEPISDYPVQKYLNDQSNLDLHKGTVKRQLLIFDKSGILETTDTLCRLTITLDPEDMLLTEDISYNFIYRNNIIRDVKYILLEQENKVIFEFDKYYCDNILEIGLDKPLFIQFIEPFTSKPNCMGV